MSDDQDPIRVLHRTIDAVFYRLADAREAVTDAKVLAHLRKCETAMTHAKLAVSDAEVERGFAVIREHQSRGGKPVEVGS